MTASSRIQRPRLAALLQLASPMLPVGAYAYSQGLERAVHDGLVTDAAGAQRWILDTLAGPIAHWEAPIWLRLYAACRRADEEAFDRWNDRFVASRETFELRAETVQMGSSLALWARDLDVVDARTLRRRDVWSFPAAFAHCAFALDVDARDGVEAYVWSWLENQVAAALKAVPLGQVAGQRMLLAAHAALDDAVGLAMRLADDELVSSAPGLALASALHEAQYSRLFRS